MKIADFHKLKKLMMLTLSSNDHEALAALKKANEIVARSSTDWNRIFERLVTVDVEEMPDDVEAAPPHHTVDVAREQRRAEVNDLLEQLRALDWTHAGSHAVSTARFIDDLAQQWTEKGWLSDAQVEALRKTLNRERRR
jgi:hypothetical protein